MYHALLLPTYFAIGFFFCISFSSSRTEFGINVSNAKYTILEIESDLKSVIFPSSDKCLMRQSFIIL